MKIAIDINELTLKQETGVKVYTREIVKALGQVDKKNEYILYCRREQKFLFPTFWTYLKLPREIKKDKPDILFMPIQSTPFFKKPKNIKLVITVHDLAFLLFPKHFTFKDRLLLNFHTKRAVQMADKIIVPSEATKKDIIKFYGIDGNKMEVIYHGVTSCHCEEERSRIVTRDRLRNPETMRANRNMTSSETKDGIAASSCGTPRNDKNNNNFSFPYILFVGTIQPRKNIVRLIEAFEKVKTSPSPSLLGGEFKNLKLIIAGGKGWMADEIYQKARESKFSNDIKFTGKVSDEELANLYRNATIFVLPSLYEGFGLPALEAMSYGVPCVVSDNSSLSEVSKGSALLVDAYNSNDIAEKMSILLNNGELRKDLSQKGIENAKRFSWIKSAEKTIKVFEGIYKF